MDFQNFLKTVLYAVWVLVGIVILVGVGMNGFAE